MAAQRVRSGLVGTVAALALGGCGMGSWLGLSPGDAGAALDNLPEERAARAAGERRSTIWDLFTNVDPPGTTVEVNRYLWNAALEVLDFLPVETVDPFSGVMVTGYGRPPGGGREYRAAVLVTDPALDARSLNVALMTRAGPASPATIRAVEDAIMTRARQLRVRDGGL